MSVPVNRFEQFEVDTVAEVIPEILTAVVRFSVTVSF
jgi:hypothetical protein